MIDHPNVHYLSFEGKEITLVGTAHISKESTDLVSRVIEETKPDTVCVTCPYCMTMFEDGLKDKGADKVQVKDIAEVVAEGLR